MEDDHRAGVAGDQGIGIHVVDVREIDPSDRGAEEAVFFGDVGCASEAGAGVVGDDESGEVQDEARDPVLQVGGLQSRDIPTLARPE